MQETWLELIIGKLIHAAAIPCFPHLILQFPLVQLIIQVEIESQIWSLALKLATKFDFQCAFQPT